MNFSKLNCLLCGNKFNTSYECYCVYPEFKSIRVYSHISNERGFALHTDKNIDYAKYYLILQKDNYEVPFYEIRHGEEDIYNQISINSLPTNVQKLFNKIIERLCLL